MKQKNRKIKCLVYLSVKGDMHTTERKEQKQFRYISEYAKAHHCELIHVYHKDVLGQSDVNHHFYGMVNRIRNKEADAILVANMDCIASGVADAYYKVGLVMEAGGQIITVDDGNLNLHLQMQGGGVS